MTGETAAAQQPLFYREPQALSAAVHGALRLLPGDAAFASQATAVPLVMTDIEAASRHYPVLFTSGEVAPVALVGLERENLFVEDGRWADGAYVPAYVRRYPLVLIEAADKSGFALGVDRSSPQVASGGEAGEPLFVDGAPSEMTKRALEFCRLFNVDHAAMRAFCNALEEEKLLVDRRAAVTLAEGRTLGVTGFQVIDPEQFAGLAEDKVVAWHRNGWLAAVHAHLASLYRFTDLMVLQAERGGGEQAFAADVAPVSSRRSTRSNGQSQPLEEAQA